MLNSKTAVVPRLIAYQHYDAPFGKLLLCACDEQLCRCDFSAVPPCGQRGVEYRCQSTPVLALTRELLDRYFAGEAVDFAHLSLQPSGTPFQQEVWQALLRIPYGQTVSYQWVARQIGRPKSVRAVANAIGANPIGIIVPCHRVIGSNGTLTGYAGGLDKKRYLLGLETKLLW